MAVQTREQGLPANPDTIDVGAISEEIGMTDDEFFDRYLASGFKLLELVKKHKVPLGMLTIAATSMLAYLS